MRKVLNDIVVLLGLGCSGAGVYLKHGLPNALLFAGIAMIALAVLAAYSASKAR